MEPYVIIIGLLFLYITYYLFNYYLTNHCSETFEPLNGNIPLIIHQTWKTNKLDNPKFKEGQESWKQLNPEFEYRFYDDTDCLNFITNHYPKYLNFYNQLSPVQKADIFRYLVIHKYGGIYTDMDTICLKSILPTLVKPMIVGIEYEPKYNKGKTQILQWFFGSVPNNPIFIQIVEEIMNRKRKLDTFGSTLMLLLDGRPINKSEETFWLTGPYIFSDLISKIDPNSIKIFDRCIFGSYDTRSKCRDKAYLIHGFEGSWKEKWGESRKRWPK